MSRIITVNSSNGQPSQEVETVARTWGELQRDLTEKGISFNGMKAIIGETRNELSSNQALLPDGTWNLFLLPKKTKSGAQKQQDKSSDMSRKEINEKIKEFITDNPDAKKHFSKDGKSYTQLSSDILIDMISSYKPSTAKPVTKDEFKKKVNKSKKVIKEDIVERLEEGQSSNTLKEVVKQAVKEVQQEWKDADKIIAILKTLDTITNSNVKTLILVAKSQLEDIAYVITIGRPRIDSLKNKTMMQSLFNDSALELRNY